KKITDTGKQVLCPMPGLVVSIAVKEGQEVKVGETVAVVEAMKMENVLHAEIDGIVKKINAKPGDSLAVDAVILEFAWRPCMLRSRTTSPAYHGKLRIPAAKCCTE